MKGLGITIGGRGNTAKKTIDDILKQGKMGDVFNELGNIYQEFDASNGTNLFEGFIMNILDSMHQSLK